MAKSYFGRTLSSYKEEARGALRYNWVRLCLIYLVFSLITGVLPAIPLDMVIGSLPMAETASIPLAQLQEITAELLATAFFTSLLAFLLFPIARVGLSRICLTRLDSAPVTLRSVFPTLKEYFKTLRLSVLTFFYAMWPMMLGFALMVGLTTTMVMTNDFSMAGMKTETTLETVLTSLAGGSVFLLWGLMIYSITRVISYSLTPYLLLIYPEKNARQLLKTSRQLTKGHKGRLFALPFTFFGWYILISLPISVMSSILTAVTEANPGFIAASAWILLATELILALPISLYLEMTLAAFTRDLCDLSRWTAPKPQPVPQPQPLPTPETDADWTDTTYQPFASSAPAAQSDDDPSDDNTPKE